MMFLDAEADDLAVFVRRRLSRFNEGCFGVREDLFRCEWLLSLKSLISNCFAAKK